MAGCLSANDIAQMMKEARMDPTLMAKEGKTYKLNYGGFQTSILRPFMTKSFSEEARALFTDQLAEAVINTDEDLDIQNRKAALYEFQQRIQGLGAVQTDANPLVETKKTFGTDKFAMEHIAMYELFNAIKTEDDIINNNASSSDRSSHYDPITGMPYIPLAKIAGTIGRKVVLSRGKAFESADGKAEEVYHAIGMSILNQLASHGVIALPSDPRPVISNRYIQEDGQALINSRNKDKSFQTAVVVLKDANGATEFVQSLLSNGTPSKKSPLGQIFDMGKYITRLSIPTTFRQVAANATESRNTTEYDINVGDAAAAMAALYQNTEMQVDEIFAPVLDNLNEQLNAAIEKGKSFETAIEEMASDKTLQSLLGITNDSAVNLGFEESVRGKEVSKLGSILSSLLQGTYANPHYSKWKWTTNGRLHDVTAIMNKQTDKFFARAITHTGKYTVKEGSDGYIHFQESIFDETGITISKLLGDSKIKEHIALMEKHLEGPNTTGAFKFMKFLTGTKTGAKEPNMPDWANSPWQYVTVLKALRDYSNMENGSFESTYMTAPDGVTSGITITLMQALGKYAATQDGDVNPILQAFAELGMVNGEFAKDEKGVKKDFYWMLTDKMNKSIEGASDDELSISEEADAFIEVAELIESGLIPIREMSKHATMPVAYSQGKASAIHTIAKALMEDMFNNLPVYKHGDGGKRSTKEVNADFKKQEYARDMFLKILEDPSFIDKIPAGSTETQYQEMAAEYVKVLTEAKGPQQLNAALWKVTHGTFDESNSGKQAQQAATFFARRVLKPAVTSYYATNVTPHLYSFIDDAVVTPLLSKYKADISKAYRNIESLGSTPRILPPQIEMFLTKDENGNYETFGTGHKHSPIVVSDEIYIEELHKNIASVAMDIEVLEEQQDTHGEDHSDTIAELEQRIAHLNKKLEFPLSFRTRLLKEYGVKFDKLREQFETTANGTDMITSVRTSNQPSVHVIIQHMIDNMTLLTAAVRTNREMGGFKAYPVHDSNIADANTNAIYTKHYSSALIDINSQYDPMSILLDTMESEIELTRLRHTTSHPSEEEIKKLDTAIMSFEAMRRDFNSKASAKKDMLKELQKEDNRQLFGFKREEVSEKPTDPTGDKKTKNESKSKPEPKKETQEAPKEAKSESNIDTSTVEGITSRLQDLYTQLQGITGGKRRLVNPQPLLRNLTNNKQHFDEATAKEIDKLGREYTNLTNEVFLDMEQVAGSSPRVTAEFEAYAQGIVQDVNEKFPDVKAELSKEMALDIIIASTNKVAVARGRFTPADNTVHLPDFLGLTEDNIEVQNVMKQENLTYPEFRALAQQIASSHQTMQTLAHEYAHAATVNWMKANQGSDEVTTIRKAMDMLKKDKQKFKKYVKEHAFKDEYEFIAEAMANPDIYEDLQNFSSESVNGIGARLLNSIKKIIDAIFGTRLAKTLRDDLDDIYKKISDTQTQFDPKQWESQESLQDVVNTSEKLFNEDYVKYMPKEDPTGILGLPNHAMLKTNDYARDMLRIGLIGDGKNELNIKDQIAKAHGYMKDNLPYYKDVSVRLKNIYMEYPSIAAIIHTSGLDDFGQQNEKDRLHSILFKAKKTRENTLSIISEELGALTKDFSEQDNAQLDQHMRVIGLQHLSGKTGTISKAKYNALVKYIKTGEAEAILSSINMSNDAATLGKVYDDLSKESAELRSKNDELFTKIGTYHGTSKALMSKSVSKAELDKNILHHLGKTEFTNPVNLKVIPYATFDRLDLETRGYTVLEAPTRHSLGVIYSPYESSGQSGLLESHNALDGVKIDNHLLNDPSISTPQIVNSRFMLTEAHKATLGKADPIQTFARSVSNNLFRDDTVSIREFLTSEGIAKDITASNMGDLNADYQAGKDHSWIISLDSLEAFNDLPKELRYHYKPLTLGQMKDLGLSDKGKHYVRNDISHWVVGEQDINPARGHGKFAKQTYNFVKKAVQWKKIRLITQNPAKIAGDLASNYTLLATMGVPAKDIMTESVAMYKAMGELQGLAIEDVKNRLAGKKSNKVSEHEYGFMYEEGFIQSITNATIADSRDTATGLQAGIDSAVTSLTQLSDGQKNAFGKLMDKASKVMIAPEYLFKYMGMGAGKMTGDQLASGLKKLEDKMSRIHTEHDGKAFIHELIGSPDGTVTQIGTAAMIAGDAVPRAILYKHLRERGDKLDHTAAVAEVNKLYIDYRVPLPKEIQFLSDIGLIMFPAFLLRVQNSAYRLAKLKPASVIGMAVAEQVLDFNAVNIEENNLFNRMYEGQTLNPDIMGAFNPENLYMNKLDALPSMDMFSNQGIGESVTKAVVDAK